MADFTGRSGSGGLTGSGARRTVPGSSLTADQYSRAALRGSRRYQDQVAEQAAAERSELDRLTRWSRW